MVEICQGSCGYQITGVTPTHCCRGCRSGRGHGPACRKVPTTTATIEEPAPREPGKTYVLKNPEKGTEFGPFEIVWKKGNALCLNNKGGGLRTQKNGGVDCAGRGGPLATLVVEPHSGGLVTLQNPVTQFFLASSDTRIVSTDHKTRAALWSLTENDGRSATHPLFPLLSVKIDPNVKFSDGEKRTFKEAGYVQKKSVVPNDLIENALRAINSRLCTPGAVVGDPGDGMRFCDDLRGSDAVTNLLYCSPVWSLAEQLIGKGRIARCGKGQIALRGPNESLASLPEGELHRSGWHIDGIGKGKHSAFTVLVGVTLSDCPTPNSGNLVVYPGSHHVLLPVIKSAVEAGALPRLEPRPELTNPVHLTAAAGDVVFAHHKLAHAGGPNAGSGIRYQVYFRLKHQRHGEFAGAGVTLEELWVEFEGLR